MKKQKKQWIERAKIMGRRGKGLSSLFTLLNKALSDLNGEKRNE